MTRSAPGALARILPGRLTPEDRRAFRAQFVTTLVIIVLLNIGFYRERERILSARLHNLPILVHGWDGWAWFVWLAAAPFTMALVRRYPLTGGHRPRNLVRVLLGSALVYVVVTNARFFLRVLAERWLPGGAPMPLDWDTYARTQMVRLPLDFLTDCGFIAASFAIDYYFKLRERAEEVQRLQLQAARLESELAEARLAALRAQLRPHFLFNTFNAIATLVRQRRNDDAIETIARLSTLLRAAIDTVDEGELTLEREVRLARCYLEIERVRFGERLAIETEVEDAARGGLVPHLILQPLVENAVKHGTSRRVEPGRIRLRAARRGDRLLIEVADNGPGFAVGTGAHADRVGLRNTRRRLSERYGAEGSLEIGPRSGGGTAVRMELPWREAGPAAPSGAAAGLEEARA